MDLRLAYDFKEGYACAVKINIRIGLLFVVDKLSCILFEMDPC
jgi:hypothetical protein